jgi:hypothetical protein
MENTEDSGISHPAVRRPLWDLREIQKLKIHLKTVSISVHPVRYDVFIDLNYLMG